jgi:hypothetical protein
MHELSTADRVWNRAALDAGGSPPREGDRALAALLLAHGMIMNGGVDHAVEALSAEELAAFDSVPYAFALIELVETAGCQLEFIEGFVRR